MKVTVVGLGLIGGSYAKGLTKKGYQVYGVDKNLETIEYAIKEGLIIDGGTNGDEFIPVSDLIVLGLYPNDVIPYIESNLHLFNEGQVITDVCGIKKSICYKATELLKKSNFVGSHPMAGREKVGVKFSDENIFKGTNFLLCPIEETKEKAISVVSQMAYDLGFKNVYNITPEFHDEMIGYTSQLTHAMAVSLVNSNNNPEVFKFIGDSYRDLTRIAMINENLWSELFIENKEELVKKIEEFVFELEKVKNAIISEDLDLLKERFVSSKKKREVM